MAPHMVSRWAPASEPPTMARPSCQVCARSTQSSSDSPMGGRNPVRRPSATTTSSSASKGATPRARATSPTVRPSASAFSGANVSSKMRRSHTARWRRMPASSDCAPASSRRRVSGSENAAMRSVERQGEHLAPSRQPVEDGTVLEAEAQLHGVGQRQRDHGGPTCRRRRPGGELVPAVVGVHGRDAEHVPVDRPVRQQRHRGEEVDLLLGEAVEAPGHDQLDRGAVVVAHGGGEALHLLPAGGPRGDGLPVAVVVRVHLRGREPERALRQGGVQRRLHGIEVRRARGRRRRRARP